MPKAIKKVLHASKTFKTPSFWDLHTHGVAGIDFMFATSEQMTQACEALGRRGIGAFAPTLLTSAPRLLEKACESWGVFLQDVRKKPKILSNHAAIPIGLHLEGPYLSPDMAGAHPAHALKNPDIRFFETLYKKAKGHIAIVTLAPELKDASALIRHLKKLKIRVQIGHTTAQKEVLAEACRHGAEGVTHLYNAMKIHHRAPGVLPFIHEKKLTAELITDGKHVDPSLVAFLWQSLRDQIYGVTDACSALGADPSQKCTLGDILVVPKNGAAYVAGTETMAGGSTWLTDHPKLYKALVSDDRAFFKLFYEIPSQLYPKIKKRLRIQSITFDKNTWEARFENNL